MLKLDPFFISKIGVFRSRVRTLFRVLTSFYQRGRGSTLRGKWIISSQIGRGRWRIYRMRRLVLPFKWKIGGRRWGIYRAWRLVLPFKWTYVPNTGPQERLSTLNSRQGMEGRMLSPGESICQHLLNKISSGDGIQGTPSWLGEDIWIRAPKLGSQAGPDGLVQLQPLVVLDLLARGPMPKPVAPIIPPFFLLGRAIVPGWKKENMFDFSNMFDVQLSWETAGK